MTAFSLKIVTPEGVQYDSSAEGLYLRTATGDAAILAGHTNYMAALETGALTVDTGSRKRTALCGKGMVAVLEGKAQVITDRFAWEEEEGVSKCICRE